MKFSATSVMLPHLDLPQTCALLRELGYDGIELRVRPFPAERMNEEPSSWGRHLTNVSPENVLERADEVKAILQEYGLGIPGFASSAQASDLEDVKLLCAGANALGSPAIRLGCPGYRGQENYNVLYEQALKDLGAALEITRAHHVKVWIEMHGGTLHPSASLAHRIASNFDASDIGVIYDPQNMVKDGFETIQLAIELLGDYLAHVHIGAHAPSPGERDENGTVKWNWSGCPLSDGLYSMPGLFECLEQVGYDGYVSIEDFRGDLTPEQRLAEAREYLRKIVG
ncbi:MAG: sugar phosphate isomerase/epimerase family protein [Planctomycetota bacterium]|jgi:sugar phosphate isomerase/epimerase|nr:sugar phosphate isomerase/epimerase family protein [Planctomycetota bacterium]MDP7248678.1 sugar phosphate isomerase/epimerase family protein [Planctomycetota bacterium]